MSSGTSSGAKLGSIKKKPDSTEVEWLRNKIIERVAENPSKAAFILTDWINNSTVKKASSQPVKK